MMSPGKQYRVWNLPYHFLLDSLILKMLVFSDERYATAKISLGRHGGI